MDELGLDSADLSGVVNESLALKAFLRMKRDENSKDLSYSFDRPLWSPRTPQNNGHLSPSLHYTPNKSPAKSTNLSRSLDFAEGKSRHDRYDMLQSLLSPYPPSQQRQLDSYEVEIKTLQEQLKNMKEEADQMLQSAIRSKRRALPQALGYAYRRWVCNVLFAAMRRWVEHTRGVSTLLVSQHDEKWKLRHAVLIDKHLNLLHAVKKRAGMLMFRVHSRFLKQQLRRRFLNWKISVRTQSLLTTQAGRVVAKRRRFFVRRRSMLMWKRRFALKRRIHTLLVNALGNYQLNFQRSAWSRWKQYVAIIQKRQSLIHMICVMKNYSLHKAFITWRHYSVLVQPKLQFARSVVIRWLRRREATGLEESFYHWRRYMQKCRIGQQVLSLAMLRLRRYHLRAAWKAYHHAVVHKRVQSTVAKRLCVSYLRSCNWSVQRALSVWKLFNQEKIRQMHVETAAHNQASVEETMHKYIERMASNKVKHDEELHLVVQKHRAVLCVVQHTVLKHLLRRNLRESFDRWSLMSKSAHLLHLQMKLHSLRLFMTQFEKSVVFSVRRAFLNWKSSVYAAVVQSKLTSRLISLCSRYHMRVSFNRWATFSQSVLLWHHTNAITRKHLRQMIIVWCHRSSHRAFLTWLEWTRLMRQRERSMKNLSADLNRRFLQQALAMWRSRCIFDELAVTRVRHAQAELNSTVRMNFYLKKLFQQEKARFFLLWRHYIANVHTIKRSIVSALQRRLRLRYSIAFRMWKDHCSSSRQHETRATQVVRVAILRWRRQILRALRKWHEIMIAARLQDTKNVKRRLLEHQQSMHVLEGEHETLRRTAEASEQRARMLNRSLTMRETTVENMSQRHYDRGVKYRCFNTLRMIRHNRKLMRSVVLRLLRRREEVDVAQSIQQAFQQWIGLTKRLRRLQRVMRAMYNTAFHRSISVAWRHWCAVTAWRRNQLELEQMHSAASMKIAGLMMNRDLVVYFMMWRQGVVAIQIARKQLKKTVGSFRKRLIRSALQRWKIHVIRVHGAARYVCAMLHRNVFVAWQQWKHTTRLYRHAKVLGNALGRLCTRKVYRYWQYWRVHCSRVQIITTRCKHLVTICQHRGMMWLAKGFRTWHVFSLEASRHARHIDSAARIVSSRHRLVLIRKLFRLWHVASISDMQVAGLTALRTLVNSLPNTTPLHAACWQCADVPTGVDRLVLGCIEWMERMLPFQVVAYIYRNGSKVLYPVTLDAAKLEAVVEDHGPIGQCASHGRYAIHTHSRSLSLALLPLHWQNRVLGVLCFSPRYRRNLSTLCLDLNDDMSMSYTGDAPALADQVFAFCSELRLSLPVTMHIGVAVFTISELLFSFSDNGVIKTYCDKRSEESALKSDQELSVIREKYEAEIAQLRSGITEADDRVRHLEKSRMKHYNHAKELVEDNHKLHKKIHALKDKLRQFVTKAMEAHSKDIDKLHASLRQITEEALTGEEAVSMESTLRSLSPMRADLRMSDLFHTIPMVSTPLKDSLK